MVRKWGCSAAVVLCSKGGGTVLEEPRLPGVEESRREPVFLAEVGDGHSVGQMSPEDGELLRGRVVLGGAFASEDLLPSCPRTRPWRFSISG
jgi:hypothetical protein